MTHMERKPCEAESGDQGDTSGGPGTPNIASIAPEARVYTVKSLLPNLSSKHPNSL